MNRPDLRLDPHVSNESLSNNHSKEGLLGGRTAASTVLGTLPKPPF